MDSPPQTHVEKLKVAALCFSMQKSIPRAAWSSIGWGVFTLLIGMWVPPRTILDYLWIGIGVFLLIEGIWLLRNTSANPANLLLESLALLILGLWNTVGIYFEVQAGTKPAFAGHAFIFGIAQLASAYATFAAYPAYKKASQHVETLYLQELDQITAGAWKNKPSEQLDIAEFMAKNKKCKAKFLPDYVVLMSNKGRKFEILGRSEVFIERNSEKLLSKSLNVKLKLGSVELKTQMKPDQFERWQAWISQATPKSASAKAPS